MIFFCQIGIFLLELGKNILFGIGNGAEFRPQNQVIESPDNGSNSDGSFTLAGSPPIMKKI